MNFTTADLCDAHADEIEIAEPIFRDFGARSAFCGPVTTVKTHEDNTLVRAALEEPGAGRVLVVDGGGSRRCALLGDRLAELAQRNDWAGVIVYGSVRDTGELARLDLGIKALAAHPLRSHKTGAGQRDVVVRFAGVTVHPGWYVYADGDGILVSRQPLV